MKNLTKVAIISAVMAMLLPVAALAAPVKAEDEETALKKGMKELVLKADNLTIKKAYFGAFKKVRAVPEVADEATTVPSVAYFKALEKAVDDYMVNRAKAGGNKQKLDIAELTYIQAVEDAGTLYLIPIEK